ncbi:MAG: DUF1549 and DUF1553 domain-containing protein, partial [Planctomycetales bacterium]
MPTQVPWTRTQLLATLAAVVIGLTATSSIRAASPAAASAAKIDALVLKDLRKHGQQPNDPASDVQFVRRVHLDVIGRIPSPGEIADFLADARPDRRARLIDKLLASDGHRSHLFNWLAEMLRVKDEYYRTGPTYTYHTWLKDQLKANRPWDEMVREMLTASGRLGENGATGYLLRDAGMPLDSLSNTLTTFLGANVACAQCHDHPFADWTRNDFYQTAAFFGATRFERDDARKPAKAMATKEFSKANLVTLLRPNMARVIHEEGRWLAYPEDYAYANAEPGDRVQPTFLRWGDSPRETVAPHLDQPETLREQFADWMVSPDNPRFARAIANRQWKRFLGLAVQEPVVDL